NHFQLSLELADLEVETFRDNLSVTEAKLEQEPTNQELRRIRQCLLKEIWTRELDLYRAKADRYPNDLTHRLEMGIRLRQLGQVDEAIKELQAAKADGRLTWRSLWQLGHCFKGRNNWRLAERNFKEALPQVPASEEGARKDVLFELAT